MIQAEGSADTNVAGVTRRRRNTVVVTGIGAVTALGADAPSMWISLLAGRSGVAELTDRWAAGVPARIAARASVAPDARFSRLRPDRSSRMALLALREAWADAGFVGTAGGRRGGLAPRAERIGVAIGSGLGGVGGLLASDEPPTRTSGPGCGRLPMPMFMVNSAAALAGMTINARAGVSAPSTACAAGAEAVAAGLDMIRSGRADVVAVGGTEALINPSVLNAFTRLGALANGCDRPEEASRPFDLRRGGFVLGEGAGILILESGAYARKRGARIYCELAGAGLAADPYDLAHPDPSGRAMAQALRAALLDARIDPQNVAHIHAHAAGMRSDPVESLAICKVVGPGRPVSAIKSMIGHLLGASGAVSAVASVQTLVHRLAPPTINCDRPDPDVEVDIVRERRSLPDGAIAVVSNASGFGGLNVSLVFLAASGRWSA